MGSVSVAIIYSLVIEGEEVVLIEKDIYDPVFQVYIPSTVPKNVKVCTC